MSERNAEAYKLAKKIVANGIVVQATERLVYQVVESCSEHEQAQLAAKDREIAALQQAHDDLNSACNIWSSRALELSIENAALREALLDCKRYAEDHDDEWIPHRVDDAFAGSPAPDPAEATK